MKKLYPLLSYSYVAAKIWSYAMLSLCFLIGYTQIATAQCSVGVCDDGLVTIAAYQWNDAISQYEFCAGTEGIVTITSATPNISDNTGGSWLSTIEIAQVGLRDEESNVDITDGGFAGTFDDTDLEENIRHIVFCAPLGAICQSDVLYGVNNESGNLMVVNPQTGDIDVVELLKDAGGTPTNGSNASTIDIQNDKLYYIEKGNTDNLYCFDLNTGANNLIGSVGGGSAGNYNRLTMLPDGRLLAGKNGSPLVVFLPTIAGIASPATFSINGINGEGGDIAIAPNGTLYMLTADTDNLYRVDFINGTYVGTVLCDNIGGTGLAIDNEFNLYYATGGAGTIQKLSIADAESGNCGNTTQVANQDTDSKINDLGMYAASVGIFCSVENCPDASGNVTMKITGIGGYGTFHIFGVNVFDGQGLPVDEDADPNTYTMTVESGREFAFNTQDDVGCGSVVIQCVATGAISFDTNVVCLGDETGDATVTIANLTGGDAPFYYQVDAGTIMALPADGVITVAAGTDHTVTVYDSNDCSTSKDIEADCCELQVDCSICDDLFIDLECEEDVPEADYSFFNITEACGEVDITHEDESNDGSGCLLDPLVITRTYEVRDDLDNVIIVKRFFTIIDVTPPSLTCPTEDLTLTCGDDFATLIENWLGEAMASDNCGTPTLKNDYDPESLFAACGDSQTITFTATDACGLETECTKNIILANNEAPEVTCPEGQILACTA
ncbi:MAG: hypothetical protein ACPGXL_03315, partial [Chitinophagales bacterium]